MPGWFDFAKNRLDSGDQIQKSYPARCDGKDGYLMMSNRKLLFVEEKGFLRKTYSFVLEVPYEKVGEITVERRQLALTDGGGRRHNITSDDVSVSTIERSLKGLIESA